MVEHGGNGIKRTEDENSIIFACRASRLGECADDIRLNVYRCFAHLPAQYGSQRPRIPRT